jgi:hypothetical protein
MTTPENVIDLTSSDDEEEKMTKKRQPEVSVKTEKKAKKAEKTKNDDEEEEDKCGCCDKAKPDLKPTGNCIGFVCEDCMEETPEMAFCDGCDRYEETNGENLCGRCQ